MAAMSSPDMAINHQNRNVRPLLPTTAFAATSSISVMSEFPLFVKFLMTRYHLWRLDGALEQVVDLGLSAPNGGSQFTGRSAFAQDLICPLFAARVDQILPLSHTGFLEAAHVVLLAHDDVLDLSDEAEISHRQRGRHSLPQARMQQLAVMLSVLLQNRQFVSRLIALRSQALPSRQRPVGSMSSKFDQSPQTRHVTLICLLCWRAQLRYPRRRRHSSYPGTESPRSPAAGKPPDQAQHRVQVGNRRWRSSPGSPRCGCRSA